MIYQPCWTDYALWFKAYGLHAQTLYYASDWMHNFVAWVNNKS